MKNKFFLSEKLLQSVVALLLVLNLIISFGYPMVSYLLNQRSFGEMVTLSPNRTTELQSVELPPISTAMIISSLLARFIFIIPLTLLGIFLIPTFLEVLFKAEQGFFIDHFLPHIFLWLFAIASIPITLKYSKGMSIWKRVIYTYLIAAFIAGLGATAWSSIFTG